MNTPCKTTCCQVFICTAVLIQQCTYKYAMVMLEDTRYVALVSKCEIRKKNISTHFLSVEFRQLLNRLLSQSFDVINS